jgi:hypothetical protein
MPGGQYPVGDSMKVELEVDGKKIPLNKFVQQFLGAGVVGMIETLDSVETPWKDIELKIKKDKE